MENIFFDLNGKTYSGYIMTSPAPDVQYLWFVFNEDEVIHLFGDAVAFHFLSGELMPVYQYTSQASFIEYLRKKVEDALNLRDHQDNAAIKRMMITR